MTKQFLFINILLATIISFASCNDKTIQGSMNFKSDTVSVGYLNGVITSNDINIVLVNEVSNYIIIQGEDNIIKQVYAFSDNGILNVNYKKDNIGKHQQVTVFVPIQHLKYLRTEGSGSLTTRSYMLHCDNDVVIELKGSGNITCPVYTKNLSVVLNGSGDIRLLGETKNANYTINGSGDILALDVQEQIVDVNVAGSGDISMNANESLIVRIGGSGIVRYRHIPENYILIITGTGRMIKI
jgi:hypothetical protein